MVRLPIFKFISSESYNGAFIMGALFASFTACIAVGFSMVQKKKMERCNNIKNLYCEINEDNVILTIINIFLKTMIITLFFSFILFILFGFGGGHIRNYYSPDSRIILKGVFHLLIIIFIYFLFHYFVAYISRRGKKKPPPIVDIFKSTLYDLDIIKEPPPIPSK